MSVFLPQRLRRMGLVLTCTLLVCACADNTAPPASEALHFDVQPELLGARVQDATHGLQFSPPITWTPVEPAMLSAVTQHLHDEGLGQNGLQVLPQSAHLNAEHGSLLIASVLRFTEASATVDEKLTAYDQALQAKFGAQALRKATFQKDGLPFVQYLIQQGEQVNFKLICTTKQAISIQFDYIVPQDVYRSEVKFIESSIGSIQPYDPEKPDR